MFINDRIMIVGMIVVVIILMAVVILMIVIILMVVIILMIVFHPFNDFFRNGSYTIYETWKVGFVITKGFKDGVNPYIIFTTSIYKRVTVLNCFYILRCLVVGVADRQIVSS